MLCLAFYIDTSESIEEGKGTEDRVSRGTISVCFCYAGFVATGLLAGNTQGSSLVHIFQQTDKNYTSWVDTSSQDTVVSFGFCISTDLMVQLSALKKDYSSY